MSAHITRDRYFPKAQLQVVYPLRVAELVNGTALERAQDQAAMLSVIMRFVTGGYMASISNSLYLESHELPAERLATNVGNLAVHTGLSEAFTKKANHRLGEYATYVAAHLLAHDTNAGLQPLTGLLTEDIPIAKNERIISIGAQSEVLFYQARMLCRKYGVEPAGTVPATGQLFTKHILPPYTSCREGEPSMYSLDILPAEPFEHPVPSVQRDIRYMQQLPKNV